MEDCQDIDLFWFNVVDDSIRTFEHLSDLPHFEFRHSASGEREFGNLL